MASSPFSWFAKFMAFSSPLASHHVLTKKTKGGLVILAVYVDDIILTGSDDTCLSTKTYLEHLIIRDLGSPRYFLGIEFAH